MMIYLNGFTIPDESAEWNFFVYGTKENLLQYVLSVSDFSENGV